MRTNPRFFGLSGVLLSAEGLTAERYLDSPQGHQVQRAAGASTSFPFPFSVPPAPQIGLDVLKPDLLLSHDTSILTRKSKKVVIRPGVLCGVLGAVNVAVRATLGRFAYDRWNDASAWTRRNLSIAGVSLVACLGGQG